MIHQLPLFQPPKPMPSPAALAFVQQEDTKLLVAFSGGKDSVAMVLHLFELGIPRERIELHHHDVDGHAANLFDWPCTPSYCQAFADAFELPLVFSYREGGIRREIFRENEGLQDVVYIDGASHRLASRPGNSTRRKFPAVAADLRTRWCSSVAKIDVLSRVVAHRYAAGQLAICTGERREESANRAKYAQFEPYRAKSQQRNAWQWRPVLDYSEREVWALMKRYKVQPHPCYELGWSRCSCQLCIFSSPNTWASLYQLAPAKIEELAAMEVELGHTLYHKYSIMDKVRAGRSFLKPSKLARWAAEAMGEYCSPIFSSAWSLPQGAYSGEAAGSL